MKKIILATFILLFATNLYAEVQFVNVGGPRLTKAFELDVTPYNKSNIYKVRISVTKDINGKFYSYKITPTLKDDEYIQSASAQFWCSPINLEFNKRSIVSKDRKTASFIYGISDNLKKDVRVRVNLTFTNNDIIAFNIYDDMENAGTNEIYKGSGGLSIKGNVDREKIKF